ncbi:unnamed protein product [Cyprideis torosa]|uniref:Uncharacterized protein n=1 Tax=Cyprideis torosa TaxID=163714 RepID=A0A7R8WLM2_9CRUS|nr:unnamed protein product [Cyprideis torosa]CAG0901771.1 unnamed protein product [Cyprideis torosa]
MEPKTGRMSLKFWATKMFRKGGSPQPSVVSEEGSQEEGEGKEGGESREEGGGNLGQKLLKKARAGDEDDREGGGDRAGEGPEEYDHAARRHKASKFKPKKKKTRSKNVSSSRQKVDSKSSVVEPTDEENEDERCRVAIVTGGNKGIGFAIVKALANHPDFKGRLYMTARGKKCGKDAQCKLRLRGYNCCFRQLDVSKCSSIKEFAAYIKQKHGRVDILINNAAIGDGTSEDRNTRMEEVLRVNYFGIVNLCEALNPLLQPHSRIVNVTSSEGHATQLQNKYLRSEFTLDTLTEEKLHQLVGSYMDHFRAGKEVEGGWPESPYSFSKVAVSALTRVQQRQFDADERPGIFVNHVHPGYVDTSLSNGKGYLTPEEGAVAPVYAALIPKHALGPKGQFLWFNTYIADWVNGPMPKPGW